MSFVPSHHSTRFCLARYAAEQLTWLILQSTSAPGSFPLSPQDLQDRLNACDRAGGKGLTAGAPSTAIELSLQ